MITAALAAASILGAHPLSATDPARQSLVMQSAGQAVFRMDAAGYVQARACNGRMLHVGNLPGPEVKIHIENDGTLSGLVWDAGLSPDQRASFRLMMQAFGMSDRRTLRDICLPTPRPGADAIQTIMDGPVEARPAEGPF
jgi:hypothetical protein